MPEVARDKQDRMIDALEGILKWTRFLGMREVKTTLVATLDTDQKKAAYQASDGVRTTREVARLAGFGSKSTVEVLWKAWNQIGLGESRPVQGGGERFKRSFDLDDFGIRFPSLDLKQKDTQESEGAGQ